MNSPTAAAPLASVPSPATAAAAAVPSAKPAPRPAYKRILLKLSGEALMGEDAYGINRATIEAIVQEIAAVARLGVEMGVVIGGGNTSAVWRSGPREWTVRPRTTWACWRP